MLMVLLKMWRLVRLVYLLNCKQAWKQAMQLRSRYNFECWFWQLS